MDKPESLANADGSNGSEKSLTLHAYEDIRADILLGKLKPSERLRINSLAQRYNVGATAVREALSRLVTGELVLFENKRGFSVASVSKTDLIDLTRTRIDIECIALERSIEQGDIEWETRIIGAYHRLSKVDGPFRSQDANDHVWREAHHEFHKSLIAGSDSPWLMRLLELLYERSERYRNLAIQEAASEAPDTRQQELNRDVLGEHKALLEATLERDVARATQILSEHFWVTTKVILATNFGIEEPAPKTRRPQKK